jgi:hypothetical protein
MDLKIMVLKILPPACRGTAKRAAISAVKFLRQRKSAPAPSEQKKRHGSEARASGSFIQAPKRSYTATLD